MEKEPVKDDKTNRTYHTKPPTAPPHRRDPVSPVPVVIEPTVGSK